MRCRAIGKRSHTQCKRGASPGKDLCKPHLRAWGLIPPEPTLPPHLRTPVLDMKGEVLACYEPVKKPPPASRTVDPVDYKTRPQDYVFICGRNPALRCKATSKRTKQRCRQPAMKGKAVCYYHGGRSCGPSTPEGRKRSGAHKLVHGWETVQKRLLRSQKVQEFRILARVIQEHGL